MLLYYYYLNVNMSGIGVICTFFYVKNSYLLFRKKIQKVMEERGFTVSWLC